MKLSTAINYRFKYQMKSGVFFFGYFCLFAILFPLFALIVSNSPGNVSSDALFSSIIFMVILAFIGISSDFKLFIQNGMSRINIFISSIISNIILSFCMALAVLMVKQLCDFLLIKNLRITLFFVDGYANDNLLISFFLLFAFMLFGSSIGSLAGTFNDRVSGFLKLFIIATLVMVPTLLILLLKIASPEVINQLFNFFKTILGVTSTGYKPLSLALTLLVVYLLFSIITYLLNMHREIKRVNG